MALSTGPIAIGTHARFFRDGAAFTVPEAGTASRTAKPGAADTGWIDLGVIADSSSTPEAEELEVWAPAPGRKVLHDVIPTKAKQTHKFTLQEFGPFTLELAERSGALDEDSDSFVPMAALAKKGWLEIKRYNHSDELVYDAYYFVYLKAAGEVNYGEGLASLPVEALVLNSSAAGGAVGTPAE